MHMRRVGLLALTAMAVAGVAMASTGSGSSWLADPAQAGVQPPQILADTQRAPEYPPAALAAGMDGAVVLAATVLKDGTVGEVLVLDSDHPNLGFETAAADALRQWRFEPAVQGGAAVDSYTMVRLHFRAGQRLREDASIRGGFIPVSGLGEAREMLKGSFALPSADKGGIHTASSGGRAAIRKVRLPPTSGIYDRRFLHPPNEILVPLPRPTGPTAMGVK